MITAATCGFPEIIKWVLKNKPGCYNNKVRGYRLLLNSYSLSLMLRVIDSGHKSTIALLIDHGADIYGTVEGSPLLKAISNANADFVEFIFERDCNPSTLWTKQVT